MHGRFRTQDTTIWFAVPHFNPCEVILLFRIRECKQVEEENVKKKKKRKNTKEHQTLYTNKRSTRSNPLYGLFQEDLG